MSNEHIQQISGLIKKEEERLQKAHLKIETGANFLAELIQGNNDDSVRVREEFLHNLKLLNKLNKPTSVQLARAKTVNEADAGNFSLWISLSDKNIENPFLKATIYISLEIQIRREESSRFWETATPPQFQLTL